MSILDTVIKEFNAGDSAEAHLVARHIDDCVDNAGYDDMTAGETIALTLCSLDELRLATIQAIARIHQLKAAKK